MVVVLTQLSVLAQLLLMSMCCSLQMSSRIFMPKSSKLSSIRMGIELTTGDYERVKFVQVADLSSTFGKFRMEATLKSSEMNEFLNEYKKEMQRRKVLFPGFRPGKLPPYVMPDIRKYLVCYGLESVIGQICNLNGLEVGNKDPLCTTLCCGQTVYVFVYVDDDVLILTTRNW
jgi:hypothetical protein